MWNALKRGLGIPTESERIARVAFQAQSVEPIAWTVLAADEETRFVVGVMYGNNRPPAIRYYAIDKATMSATELDGDSAYRPKVWR